MLTRIWAKQIVLIHWRKAALDAAGGMYLRIFTWSVIIRWKTCFIKICCYIQKCRLANLFNNDLFNKWSIQQWYVYASANIFWLFVKQLWLFNPQIGNGVFSTFPGNGGGGNLPHTVQVILYAIGDRYQLAVKIYSAEMIGGINQYSAFTNKFQNGRQNGRRIAN